MSDPGGSWTLLTGHGHVLVEIARDPEARIRDISTAVGLTERTVQAIVADLEAAGYLARTRNGRRTKYTVNRDSLFRHSAQEGLRVGPLLDLLVTEDAAAQDLAAQDDAAGKDGKDKDGAVGVQAEPTTARHRPTLRRRRR
jgi:DNA-binding MarR family transcriptional regulator